MKALKVSAIAMIALFVYGSASAQVHHKHHVKKVHHRVIRHHHH